MELKGKKVAFLGDSITEGYGASGVDKTYWSILGQETGAEVFGYGIGGTNDFGGSDPAFGKMEVAGFYGIPVVDLFRTCPIQPRFEPQRQLLMPDGVHPNDAGHRIIARRLISAMQAL